jgi:hypothetical protein
MELNDFLQAEVVLCEARAVALKEALAWQVQQATEKENLTKVEMARRMNTGRAALDRLIDPGNASVTFQTLKTTSLPLNKLLGSGWIGFYHEICVDRLCRERARHVRRLYLNEADLVWSDPLVIHQFVNH